jgi:hypothetical protein
MKLVTMLLLGIALLHSASTAAQAQQKARPLLLEAYGAYVFTSGGHNVNDGWGVGGLVGLTFIPHVWLMGNLGYSWFSGEGSLPNWKTDGYFAMLGYDIVPPGMNGSMIFFVGAGRVTFDQQEEGGASQTFDAFNGGLKVVYDFNPHVSGTLDLGATLALSEGDLVGGDVWYFPLGFGLAFRF